MSSSVTIQQAVDFTTATFEHIATRKPAYTFAHERYDDFNTFWRHRVRVQGGKRIEGRIVLGDEGNAKHSSIYDDDTHNVVNISKRYSIEWVHSTTNFSYNLIETSLNNGLEEIYDIISMKYDNMCREWTDEVLGKMWLTPASSSDDLTPHGISAWICLGTDNSTGGWTGYRPKYGDGNNYSVGGLTSTSTTNARWASWYADHNGNLDDNLLVLLDRACRKLNFHGPSVPKTLGLNTKGYKPTFSLYSNDTVIGTLNQLYAKSDDQMGARINTHYNIPYFKNMPFQYAPTLDDADTNRYGTNPVYGINHNMIYPVVSSEYNWKITPPVNRAPAGQHLWMTVYGDVEYAIFAVNRRYAGFLVSEQ